MMAITTSNSIKVNAHLVNFASAVEACVESITALYRAGDAGESETEPSAVAVKEPFTRQAKKTVPRMRAC
jgi:hypothetical protein